MCTLYNLKKSREEVAAHFRAGDRQNRDLDKDYVASNRPGYVVRELEGVRELEVMKWGFPPPASAKGPVVNVRNLRSPFWRPALSTPERRCLVPATEFSEWDVTPDPETHKRNICWFGVPSQPIFAMAGIWRPTAGDPVYAFCTCEPNPLVALIHPKAMPVILHPEDYDQWLRGTFDEACALVQPFPSQMMVMA